METVRSRLAQKLAAAQQRLKQARGTFKDTLENAGFLAGPDGVLLIRKVTRDYHDAEEQYMKAVKNQTDFLTNGVMPDDITE